jgi:hypothetical protein
MKECYVQRVGAVVTEDRMMTVGANVMQCGIRHSAMQVMIKTLGYQKVCCHHVPLMLKGRHKRACMDVSSLFLHQHSAKGGDYLLNTVTGNGSRFHCFDQKTKLQSYKCHGTASPRRMRPETYHLLEKLLEHFSGMLSVPTGYFPL